MFTVITQRMLLRAVFGPMLIFMIGFGSTSLYAWGLVMVENRSTDTLYIKHNDQLILPGSDAWDWLESDQFVLCVGHCDEATHKVIIRDLHEHCEVPVKERKFWKRPVYGYKWSSNGRSAQCMGWSTDDYVRGVLHIDNGFLAVLKSDESRVSAFPYALDELALEEQAFGF